MNENKKSGLVVLIVVLVLMVLGLGGFIIYDKVLDDNSIGTDSSSGSLLESKNKNVENLEVTDSLVTGLLDKISLGLACVGQEHLYMQDKKVEADTFSNSEVYSLALNNLMNKLMVRDAQQNITFNSFTEAELDAEIENMLGKDYKFVHKTYESVPLWNYDATSKTYVNDPTAIGGCVEGPYHDLVKTVKAEKSDDKIEIYQRAIFVDSTTGKGYSDFAKTKEITDLVLTYEIMGDETINIIDENNDSNFNKGALYKMVFAEENNNYVFKSAELAD